MKVLYDNSSNNILKEEVIHYAAAFLERFEDKNPSHEHRETQKELRRISNYLLENLGKPATLTVVRHKKKDD